MCVRVHVGHSIVIFTAAQGVFKVFRGTASYYSTMAKAIMGVAIIRLCAIVSYV